MDRYLADALEIPLQEAAFLSAGGVDDVGRVFTWQGRLLRAVRPGHVAGVEALLAGGLLPELRAAGLFPAVSVTNYRLQGFGLILEHERIPTVTYPYEWSFAMLRDAALAVLRVNQIARKYGFQTKDAHGYNVLFHGSHPLFIDLGSFIKIEAGFDGWQGYEEFLHFFYYPLKLWSDGNGFLARRILSGAMLPLMPHESYLAYRLPPARSMTAAARRRLARLPQLLRRAADTPAKDLQKTWPGMKGHLLRMLRALPGVRGGTADFAGLMRKMGRLDAGTPDSRWAFYQEESGLVDASGAIRPSPRFMRLAELVDQFEVREILELAGNQGALARYLLSATAVERVICTDYDDGAIDSLYRSIGSEQRFLTPAVLDFMAPAQLAETRPPQQRLRAEAVLALAITHHLLLRRRLAVDAVLSQICQFAQRFVFVEFMPLGLYAGRTAPDLPAWYTRDWFRAACARHFHILIEEELEENRILFVGRLEKR